MSLFGREMQFAKIRKLAALFFLHEIINFYYRINIFLTLSANHYVCATTTNFLISTV